MRVRAMAPDQIWRDTMTILADYPAVTVVAAHDGYDIQLDNDKGYARTSNIEFMLRGFPKDKYEYIRSFTIGSDDETGVWAFGNGAMLTSEKRAKKIAIGIELGQTIRVEGRDYVEAAPNKNIKLTPA